MAFPDVGPLDAPLCPFLGRADDERTSFTFPHFQHRCYAVPRRRRVDNGYQAAYCLGAFADCPRFQKASADPKHADRMRAADEAERARGGALGRARRAPAATTEPVGAEPDAGSEPPRPVSAADPVEDGSNAAGEASPLPPAVGHGERSGVNAEAAIGAPTAAPAHEGAAASTPAGSAAVPAAVLPPVTLVDMGILAAPAQGENRSPLPDGQAEAAVNGGGADPAPTEREPAAAPAAASQIDEATATSGDRAGSAPLLPAEPPSRRTRAVGMVVRLVVLVLAMVAIVVAVALMSPRPAGGHGASLHGPFAAAPAIEIRDRAGDPWLLAATYPRVTVRLDPAERIGRS